MTQTSQVQQPSEELQVACFLIGGLLTKPSISLETEEDIAEVANLAISLARELIKRTKK